jgi:Ca2+-binding EF-hand superfamily protein
VPLFFFLLIISDGSFTDMSSELTQEELTEFRDIFNLADKESKGYIDKAQLTDLMETLGIE